MDYEKFITQMNDEIMDLRSQVNTLMGLVKTLSSGGVDQAKVEAALKAAFPGSPEPADKKPAKPTVYEFLKQLYSLAEGDTITAFYGPQDSRKVIFKMMVPVAVAPSPESPAPCGLLRVYSDQIGGGFASVGLRCDWISLGIRYPFFDDMMNAITDDPDVGGTWRTAYTKKGGWAREPFVRRQFGENSKTGLRDEVQVSPKGKRYRVYCSMPENGVDGLKLPLRVQ